MMKRLIVVWIVFAAVSVVSCAPKPKAGVTPTATATEDVMAKKAKAGDSIQVGSKVAIYLEEGWRLAEVTAVNGNDYTVSAPWGMTPTVTRDKLVPMAKESEVKEGMNVFAYNEEDGSFLQGYISTISKDGAFVNWADGMQYCDVPLDRIITDTVAICGEDLNIEEEDTRIQLYYKGSNVGLIEHDDSVWLRNRTVGRIDADYNVYDGTGTKLGYVSGENVYKGGQVVGTVTSDGEVWIPSLNKGGKIDDEGVISLDNTEIGQAKGLDPVKAAIIYFFFFDMIQ